MDQAPSSPATGQTAMAAGLACVGPSVATDSPGSRRVKTMNQKAIVRRPSSRLADGLLTFLERRSLDLPLALRQWEGYVEAFRAAGWETIEVDPIDLCPDGVFIEDTMVVYRNTAVISHPGTHLGSRSSGLPRRRSPPSATQSTGSTPPGCSKAETSSRSATRSMSAAAAARMQKGCANCVCCSSHTVLRVVAVPITKVLHLKSAVTALPDGTILGYTPVVDDPGFFPHYLGVPEASGAHVVDLGGGRLLTAADCPKSVAIIEDVGYEVVQVDVSEFQKLEGCVTCLSVRLRGLAD